MPPTVKISAFFDNKLKKNSCTVQKFVRYVGYYPANRHGLFSVTVSNLYPRSIVPFVPEFRAKVQKNTLSGQKPPKKHTQNAFFNTFRFVMSNLFRIFAA